MKESSSHHFVPRVYLKYFATKRKSNDYFLYVYDKMKNKTFPRNICDIGYGKNYNRVHNGKYLPAVPDDNELYYEKKFQELIENDWDSIVHSFMAICTLSTEQKKLSYEMKYALARFIVIQTLRTPIAREFTRKIGLETSQRLFANLTPIIRDVPRDDIKEAFFKMKRDFRFNEDEVKSYHLLVTTDNKRIEEFAKRLVQSRIWVAYRSPDKHVFPFITSDNPVVFYDPISGKYGIGNNGIEVNTTIIGFPVTPEYYIITFHKISPLGDISSVVGDECITVDSKIVANLDRHQTNQCYRQVYIPLDLGEDIMNEEKTK